MRGSLGGGLDLRTPQKNCVHKIILKIPAPLITFIFEGYGWVGGWVVPVNWPSIHVARPLPPLAGWLGNPLTKQCL